MDTNLRLVGDIGGTNARFALARLGGARPVLDHVAYLAVANYATAQEGIAHYLSGLPMASRPADAVLAVAGPVVRGIADLTNASGWHLDEARLAALLGLQRVQLINDFEALSLSVPALQTQDLMPIGGHALIDAKRTVSLLGPGTGTGVGARVVYHGQASVLVCEGGHIAFAPGDEIEIEILRVLMQRFGRVSVERLLCGQGLVNLHQALAVIEAREVHDVSAADITGAALTGDRLARATLDRFFAILGAVAGDVALAHGAVGGVLLAGGILPRVADLLQASPFRARFENKGRLSKLNRAIATNLLMAQDVALLGAAGA